MKNDVLNRIYNNLIDGGRYTKTYQFSWDVCGDGSTEGEYPVLSYFAGRIYYEHFGSSAIKATRKELSWLLSVIFKLTPEQFEREYNLRFD